MPLEVASALELVRDMGPDNPIEPRLNLDVCVAYVGHHPYQDSGIEVRYRRSACGVARQQIYQRVLVRGRRRHEKLRICTVHHHGDVLAS